MNATAANLIEHVLPPQAGLRQWVLTGTVGAVQRTSSDLRLNPKLHVVVLDGFTLHAATRAGGLQSQDEEESGGEREVNGSRGRAGPELSIWGFTDGVGFAATQGGSA